MVYPSVQDFINRSDWLIESGSLKWIETQKEKNPFKPVLKVQVTTNKPKVRTHTNNSSNMSHMNHEMTHFQPQKTKQQEEIDLKQKDVDYFIKIFPYKKWSLFGTYCPYIFGKHENEPYLLHEL